MSKNNLRLKKYLLGYFGKLHKKIVCTLKKYVYTNEHVFVVCIFTALITNTVLVFSVSP